MDAKPSPGDQGAVEVPSSVMIISRVPSSAASRTEASLASECRTTLVSASAAIRYAATSTEDGSAGMDSGCVYGVVDQALQAHPDGIEGKCNCECSQHRCPGASGARPGRIRHRTRALGRRTCCQGPRCQGSASTVRPNAGSTASRSGLARAITRPHGAAERPITVLVIKSLDQSVSRSRPNSSLPELSARLLGSRRRHTVRPSSPGRLASLEGG
jgi:hypothetical protein